MSPQRIVLVTPVAEGWAVSAPDIEPLVFRSGARAERHARALAAGLAQAGEAVQVRVLDRSRTLVGTQHYPAMA